MAEGNEMPKRGFSEYKQQWADVAKRRAEALEAGHVLIECVRAGKGIRLHLVAPFSDQLVIRAREISGRWRPKTKAWTFPIRSARLVYGIAMDLYGKDRIQCIGWSPD